MSAQLDKAPKREDDVATATHAEAAAKPGDESKMVTYDDGSVRVGKIKISANVAAQLREQGHSFDAYTEDQLMQAIHACHIDGKLVADEHGINFIDILTKTAAEHHEDQHYDDPQQLAYRNRGGKVNTATPKPNWAERVGGSTTIPSSYVEQVNQDRTLAREHAHEHTAA